MEQLDAEVQRVPFFLLPYIIEYVGLGLPALVLNSQTSILPVILHLHNVSFVKTRRVLTKAFFILSNTHSLLISPDNINPALISRVFITTFVQILFIC